MEQWGNELEATRSLRRLRQRRTAAEQQQREEFVNTQEEVGMFLFVLNLPIRDLMLDVMWKMERESQMASGFRFG